MNKSGKIIIIICGVLILGFFAGLISELFFEDRFWDGSKLHSFYFGRYYSFSLERLYKHLILFSSFYNFLSKIEILFITFKFFEVLFLGIGLALAVLYAKKYTKKSYLKLYFFIFLFYYMITLFLEIRYLKLFILSQKGWYYTHTYNNWLGFTLLPRVIYFACVITGLFILFFDTEKTKAINKMNT